PCFHSACCVSSKIGAYRGETRNQLAVAACQTILVELDVVFQTGTDVPPKLKAPLIDFKLMASDSGGRPRCIGHQLREFPDQEFQQLASGRQRVWNAHYELNLAGPLEQTAISHVLGIIEHRCVENLDFGLNAVFEH